MKVSDIVLLLISIPLLLQSGQPTQPAISVGFEHVAFNVADPPAVAKWYCDNMAMKIVKAGPAPQFAHFVSDTAGRMMFELYHNDQAKVIDYKQIDPNSFHLAFETGNVQDLRDRLLKAGATVAKDLWTTDTGDMVIILRDPWGLPIQLLKRAQPMLKR